MEVFNETLKEVCNEYLTKVCNELDKYDLLGSVPVQCTGSARNVSKILVS